MKRDHATTKNTEKSRSRSPRLKSLNILYYTAHYGLQTAEPVEPEYDPALQSVQNDAPVSSEQQLGQSSEPGIV